MRSSRNADRSFKKRSKKTFIPDETPAEARSALAKDMDGVAENWQIKAVAKFANRNAVSATKLANKGVPPALHEPIRLTAQRIHGTSHPFIRSSKRIGGATIAGGTILVAGVAASHVGAQVKEYNEYKKILGKDMNPKLFYQKFVKDNPIQIVVPKNASAKEMRQYVTSSAGRVAVSTMLVVGVTIAIINAAIKKGFRQRIARKSIERVEKARAKANAKKGKKV
jgi:hypothetical protein